MHFTPPDVRSSCTKAFIQDQWNNSRVCGLHFSSVKCSGDADPANLNPVSHIVQSGEIVPLVIPSVFKRPVLK